MTKVELLDAAAKRSGVTKTDAERVRYAFAIAVTSSTAPKFTASSTLKADLKPTRK